MTITTPATAGTPPPSAPPAIPPGRGQRLRNWLRTRGVILLLVFLILLLFVVYSWPDWVVEIGPGEAGVLWKRFGGGTVTVAADGKPFIGRIGADAIGEATSLIENEDQKEDAIERHGHHHAYPYREGTRFIWPWDRMFIYNIRLQQISHTYDVLTNDGLQVQAEIAITFKPIEADLGKLHRDIGPTYIDTLLIPIVGACAREEIARYPPDALYSPVRLQIQEAIRTKVKQFMLSRFYPASRRESLLMVEDVLIRDVVLPPEVRAAIEDKVTQKHIADSYPYRLDRERQEADRKAIEAEGIRRFQATINSTISDGYLKYKGIEATLELAKSPNAKIVVIGTGGKDGMPLILGGLDNLPGPAVPATPLAATSPAGVARSPGAPSAPAPARPATP